MVKPVSPSANSLMFCGPQLHILFKIHSTVANLHGCGCKSKTDDKLKRLMILMGTKSLEPPPKALKVNSKIMVYHGPFVAV